MLHLVLASAAVNPSLAAKSNQSAFHDAVWLSWCSLPFMVQSAFHAFPRVCYLLQRHIVTPQHTPLPLRHASGLPLVKQSDAVCRTLNATQPLGHSGPHPRPIVQL